MAQGRGKGRGAAGEAHRADGDVLPAGAVHGADRPDHHPGDEGLLETAAEIARSIAASAVRGGELAVIIRASAPTMRRRQIAPRLAPRPWSCRRSAHRRAPGSGARADRRWAPPPRAAAVCGAPSRSFAIARDSAVIVEHRGVVRRDRERRPRSYVGAARNRRAGHRRGRAPSDGRQSLPSAAVACFKSRTASSSCPVASLTLPASASTPGRRGLRGERLVGHLARLVEPADHAQASASARPPPRRCRARATARCGNS